ncbi:GGDEF domain-containing protein [uncultured Desulfuromusa sp.]|uniref:GGDEF domain-containing protein n=1 Tax=uncultured Desulfuromusa sp. TaxID=219183 RepID=UPI002AA8CC47|nr:GGDEF domain-containing protein [uncultured Desulfuromusa sp.]
MIDEQNNQNFLQYNSRLATLPLHAVSLQLNDLCYKISQAFKKQPDLPGVLLFDHVSFHSMISRRQFFEIMNLPYSKDLFSQREIKKLVKKINLTSPVYTSDTLISDAVKSSLQRPPEQLTEPIVIINDNGSHAVIDIHELLCAHAHIFSATVAKLQAEIIRSDFLREKLEQANREAEKLARLDGLTGIPNRRQMDEYLRSEWQRGMRNKTSLAIILMDIDFFKAFNDTYGHQAGDDVLARVATCLRQQIHRPADMVARYGGEEFLAILPETFIAGALTLAEKIRLAVSELMIPNKEGAFLSISCGVSCLNPVRRTDLSILSNLQTKPSTKLNTWGETGFQVYRRSLFLQNCRMRAANICCHPVDANTILTKQ